MPSQCPKCHSFVEDDSVCCADLRFTWKCRECHKISEGFVIPYGRCYLCGGELEVIDKPAVDDIGQVEIVHKGIQFEINACHYYRIAAEQVSDPASREVFTDFAEKELEHYRLLVERYHVHDAPDLNEGADDKIMKWLMEGIDFTDAESSIRTLYDRAIQAEVRTRDFYREQADQTGSEKEKEFYLQLAAEEEDHKTLLETERDAFFG